MGERVGAKTYTTWQEKVKRKDTTVRKYSQYQYVRNFDKLIRKK